MPTKTLRKGLLGYEDINIGVGSFSRGTSTGGTQTMTKVSLFGFTAITATTATTVTATVSTLQLVSASSGAVTVNFPTAVGNTGKTICVKKTDSSANAVTIDGATTELLDDAQTYIILLQNEMATFMSDGTQWWRIA